MKFYPYAVCIDFRGLLFMGSKKRKKKAHFLLRAGNDSFRNDILAQDGELLKI